MADQPQQGYIRRECSECGEGLGFSESDPCDRCRADQPDQAPERIWFCSLNEDFRDLEGVTPREGDVEYVRADLARKAKAIDPKEDENETYKGHS